MDQDSTRYTERWASLPPVASFRLSMTAPPTVAYAQTNHVKLTLTNGHEVTAWRDGRLALHCPMGDIAAQDFMFAMSGEVPCKECMTLVAVYRGATNYWSLSGSFGDIINGGQWALVAKRNRPLPRARPAWDKARNRPDHDAWLSFPDGADSFRIAMEQAARRSKPTPRIAMVAQGRGTYALKTLRWDQTDFCDATIYVNMNNAQRDPWLKASCSVRPFRRADKYIDISAHMSWYQKVFCTMGGTMLDTQRDKLIVVMAIEAKLVGGGVMVHAIKLASPFGNSHLRRAIMDYADNGTGTMRWVLRKWVIGTKGVV